MMKFKKAKQLGSVSVVEKGILPWFSAISVVSPVLLIAQRNKAESLMLVVSVGQRYDI